MLGVVLLIAGSVGPVGAATGGGDGSYTQAGKSADVWSGDCLSNGDGTTTCNYIGLSAFVGKMNDGVSGAIHVNQLCVNLDSFTYEDETGLQVGEYRSEAGCRADVPTATLAFGSGLSSAHLASTTLSVDQMTCTDKYDCSVTSSRPITISGTWTGVGLLQVSKYRSSSNDGICRFAESGKGSSREATFSGVIDGIHLDGAYASLRDAKTSYRSRCREF
jgi:hypothetical protein